MRLNEVLALVFMIGGLFFCIVGILGFIRFPDVYSRIHSTGKVSTLGLIGILIGAAFVLEGAAPRVLALAVFVLLTAPVSSHAIASAAYRQGVPLNNPVRDDLADYLTKTAEESQNRTER